MTGERHVTYGACENGYCIQLFNGDECIAESCFGNSPYHPKCYVDPEDGLGLEKLYEMAKMAAAEIAGSPDRVAHDPDIDSQLKTHFQQQKPPSDAIRTGPYVIVRTDGKFVTRPGSEQSYSDKLQHARPFETREAAERERCVENERVVSVRDLIMGLIDS